MSLGCLHLNDGKEFKCFLGKNSQKMPLHRLADALWF
jgi:hypothetical protein